MWWKIAIVVASILLGYWAWFDRRFYGFGLVASALWALGIFIGVSGSSIGLIEALTWMIRRI